jgi:hypothetical protein
MRVHGLTRGRNTWSTISVMAMAWGAGILLVTAIPALVLVNAKALSPRR